MIQILVTKQIISHNISHCPMLLWEQTAHTGSNKALAMTHTHTHTPMPSVLWRCWLGGRKGIWPVKNWVVGCWHGYVSGSRCRFACKLNREDAMDHSRWYTCSIGICEQHSSLLMARQRTDFSPLSEIMSNILLFTNHFQLTRECVPAIL